MSELVVAKSFSKFFSEANFSEWSKYHPYVSLMLIMQSLAKIKIWLMVKHHLKLSISVLLINQVIDNF